MKGYFDRVVVMRKTLSLDLREKMVEAYDAKEGTREEVARRFKMSLEKVLVI